MGDGEEDYEEAEEGWKVRKMILSTVLYCTVLYCTVL